MVPCHRIDVAAVQLCLLFGGTLLHKISYKKNFVIDSFHCFFIVKIICIATFGVMDLCCATAQLLFRSNLIC